jgi:DNA-binding Lrp family transcriptional regulator
MSTEERLALKTPEQAFLQILKKEFHFSPRLARDVLAAAQEGLVGTTPERTVRPGQVRLVVASRQAPFGPPLAATAMVEVTLTIDAGAEDSAVREEEGAEGLRRGRILRLLDEALEQGGVLTQEDLGRALGVTARTIRRDMRLLKEEGHLLHTRGRLKGVGRGQTHKARIIELWLDREGYDKIARWLHHSPQAIKRYVSTFLRVVALHEKGTAVAEIAFLTKSSVKVVNDYLAIYTACQSQPHRQEKLAEELARVNPVSEESAGDAEKKGVMNQ